VSEPRHTQAELLEEARAAGFGVSQGLIERYVTLGLLDAAQPDGTGRGYRKGVRWSWSENQRRLWLTVLDKRRQTDKPRALANIPVQIWLYWGEDYVPLRQVRRSLETYSEVRKSARRHDYPRAARSLVNSIARRAAFPRARAALVDALVEAAHSRQLDVDLIRPLLNEVVGAADPTAQTDGPRMLFNFAAQWAATSRFDDLTDAHFRWARAFVLYGQADYARTRDALAADPRFGALHQPFDFQYLSNRACQDVLFVLGMSLVAPPDPGVPEPFQIEPWLEDRVHLDTHTEVKRSALLLPPGISPESLSIEVRIQVDPKSPTVFLGRADATGLHRVVAVRPGLGPWSGVVWYVRGAHGVLELPPGTIAASGTAVGDDMAMGAPWIATT
jgi:hypothetical protein